MPQNNLLKWEFAATGGGDEVGVNDPVISNFTGNITTKLVREALQNSIDAGVKEPVIVKFDIITTEALKIPGIEQLRSVYGLCVDYWSSKGKRLPMFNILLGRIQKNLTIPVLKISDFNTRGLTPGDYYALFQCVGGETKPDGEGGSWGLGKGAYFGASAFRMVFASSKYDDNKYHFAGKARLPSFTQDGKTMQGNGTYGYPAQKPVIEEQDIPDSFKREERGTDFYIYGYQGTGDWKKEIIKAVLENFWYAIMQNNLIVIVGGTTINAEALDNLMIEYFGKPKSKNEFLKSPYPFFLACRDENTSLTEGDLHTLGAVKLYVLKNESFPKDVVYIRNTGMVIQKKGRNAPYGYAGVFVCENTEGNKILCKMENPEHDQWNKDIAISLGKLNKNIANNADRELKDFVINTLKGLQEKDEGDVLHVKELDKYLWLPMDEDESLLTGSGSEGLEKPSNTESASEEMTVDKSKLEIISRKEKLVIDKKIVKGVVGEEDLFVKVGHGRGKRRRANGLEDPEGDKQVVQVTEMKYRSFAELNNFGKYEHTLIIKSPRNKKLAKIVVHVGTDNSLDDIDIYSAIDDDSKISLDIEGNIIKDIELNDNGQKKVLIQFNDHDKYSLNIIAYEYK